jgi:hypothetical protein
MANDQWTRRQFLAVTGATGLTTCGVTRALCAAAVSNYEKAVLAKEPVGYWRLGEAKGQEALDSSANRHQGVYHGAPVFRERGALKDDPNTAIKLDGKGSYVEIADHKNFSQPTSGKGLTVEVWVRPDVLEFDGETTDPHVHWLGKGEAAHQEWGFRFYSKKSKRPNRISAYIWSPTGGLGAGAYFEDELKPGEWIHVVACYDPGDALTKGKPGVHIYKNGVHRGGPPSAGTLYDNPRWHIKPAHGPAPVRLGTRDRKSFLTGGLDEVAIYPRVLTAREIAENYEAGQGRARRD